MPQQWPLAAKSKNKKPYFYINQLVHRLLYPLINQLYHQINKENTDLGKEKSVHRSIIRQRTNHQDRKQIITMGRSKSVELSTPRGCNRRRWQPWVTSRRGGEPVGSRGGGDDDDRGITNSREQRQRDPARNWTGALVPGHRTWVFRTGPNWALVSDLMVFSYYRTLNVANTKIP
jgi:hypothetical protein